MSRRAGRESSEEPTVFDASPLVFLDLPGYIPLLRRLYRVVLPETVSKELSIRPGLPGGEVVSLDWVVRRTPSAEVVRRVRREPPAVGRGETEVIALGLELSCPVVLDDRKARLRARRAGLEIIGALGILLKLHHLELTSRNLEEDLRLLEEAGIRISPGLRRSVLEAESQLEDEPGRR